MAGLDLTPLRIALTVDPYHPVPPAFYGGIERVVATLAQGLLARGHEVTLWAAPGSTIPCPTIAYGRPPHQRPQDRLGELFQVMSTLTPRAKGFDLVHSFGRLAALLPLLPRRRLPTVQSYQRAIARRSVVLGHRLAGRSLVFTACSTSCRRPVSDVGQWETIYNCVPLEVYTCRPTVDPDAPLVFLGRLERIKGAHTAIAVARRSGRRLVLAGNVVDEPEAKRYFETKIRPHLGDDRVRYIGPVDDARKNRLLGEAAALLMPIEWEEPFGIVMAEALACGTPVIGLRRGAVPEVVADGTTGFVCDTVAEMALAVGRLGRLERRACRARCAALFSGSVIVGAYEDLYQRHIERCRS